MPPEEQVEPGSAIGGPTPVLYFDIQTDDSCYDATFEREDGHFIKVKFNAKKIESWTSINDFSSTPLHFRCYMVVSGDEDHQKLVFNSTVEDVQALNLPSTAEVDVFFGAYSTIQLSPSTRYNASVGCEGTLENEETIAFSVSDTPSSYMLFDADASQPPQEFRLSSAYFDNGYESVPYAVKSEPIRGPEMH